MDETLLRLCCQEFETFEEVCKANPYGPSSDPIRYTLPNYGYGRFHTMPILGTIEIRRLTSGRFIWMPREQRDAELVEAAKKLIREEQERAIATIEKEVRRAVSDALSTYRAK